MRNRAARGGALAVLLPLAACTPGSGTDDGNGAVYAAWLAQRSNVEVTASGSVVRLLGTRAGRSGRHEGFLLHLRGAAGRGLGVRVEDNVDLTGPIPLQEGEAVVVRGEYVYAAAGGIIHYTHRDPRGRHAAGYVRTADGFYQ